MTRASVVRTIEQVHSDHHTNGYRWTADFMRINLHIVISANFAYKCFHYLVIVSETRHKPHGKARKVRDIYPNLILSTWETVGRPRQVIVSDMTALKFYVFYFEVTFYFDVFTKEMLSYRLADRRGSRKQYIRGLQDVVALLKGTCEPTVHGRGAFLCRALLYFSLFYPAFFHFILLNSHSIPCYFLKIEYIQTITLQLNQLFLLSLHNF